MLGDTQWNEGATQAEVATECYWHTEKKLNMTAGLDRIPSEALKAFGDNDPRGDTQLIRIRGGQSEKISDNP